MKILKMSYLERILQVVLIYVLVLFVFTIMITTLSISLVIKAALNVL